MQSDKELLTLLSGLWIYLILGAVHTILGFAIIFSNWDQYLQHPIRRRYGLLPAMLISYFLMLTSIIVGAWGHGHTLVAEVLIIIGLLQVTALLYRYRLYRLSKRSMFNRKSRY